MGGKTVSVYLKDEDVETVVAHAKRVGASFSRALRDLLRTGAKARELGRRHDVG